MADDERQGTITITAEPTAFSLRAGVEALADAVKEAMVAADVVVLDVSRLNVVGGEHVNTFVSALHETPWCLESRALRIRGFSSKACHQAFKTARSVRIADEFRAVRRGFGAPATEEPK